MTDIEEQVIDDGVNILSAFNPDAKDNPPSPSASGDEGEATKTLQKVKKPRTEKQKNALKKAQEVRRELNIKKKEKRKEYMEDEKYFKKLTREQRKKLKNIDLNPSPPDAGKRRIIYDSSEEEEIIIVKKKNKRGQRRRKPKKIIYEDDTTSDDEPIVKEIQKPVEEELDYEEPLTYGTIARFL